eukprot:g1727.t1
MGQLCSRTDSDTEALARFAALKISDKKKAIIKKKKIMKKKSLESNVMKIGVDEEYVYDKQKAQKKKKRKENAKKLERAKAQEEAKSLSLNIFQSTQNGDVVNWDEREGKKAHATDLSVFDPFAQASGTSNAIKDTDLKFDPTQVNKKDTKSSDEAEAFVRRGGLLWTEGKGIGGGERTDFYVVKKDALERYDSRQSFELDEKPTERLKLRNIGFCQPKAKLLHMKRSELNEKLEGVFVLSLINSRKGEMYPLGAENYEMMKKWNRGMNIVLQKLKAEESDRLKSKQQIAESEKRERARKLRYDGAWFRLYDGDMEGKERQVDPNTGRFSGIPYYWHAESGCATFEKPLECPPQTSRWERCYDFKLGLPYSYRDPGKTVFYLETTKKDGTALKKEEMNKIGINDWYEDVGHKRAACDWEEHYMVEEDKVFYVNRYSGEAKVHPDCPKVRKGKLKKGERRESYVPRGFLALRDRIDNQGV